MLLPRQGWLNACFSRALRQMDNKSGAEARRAWLDQHFGGIDIVRSGARYIACLPKAYRVRDISPTDFSLFIARRLSLSHERIKLVPHRLSEEGLSLQESIDRLHQSVIELLDTQGMIDIYRPKQGQPENIIVPGQTYSCIQHEDEFHDHASADLIDFTIKPVSPRVQRVYEVPFENNHMHIMSMKIAP
ncbi:MAG: hypothetical protein HYS17_09510 [Micavibrio aeruginosavorus]|uniref:Uncharacterized protein n=1 Tax=Micavibrio aeruginosavorus TaxID=349221 RepID=A0A7T5UG06_9BACT|nr:MAG: hypothetical protein HYS17_09510 [Micavibrio aeruginosavorus]